MATSAQWSHGYARQADADFRMFQALQPDPAAAICHKLLFLQMACEKLVKAHLCAGGVHPAILQTSHAYVAASLPVVLRHTATSLNIRGQHAKWLLRHAKHLAQEIEVLAPAVKRGGNRPDNCEYPWEDGNGELRVPLDWSFHPERLLVIPAGRTFLKLVRAAIYDLLPP